MAGNTTNSNGLQLKRFVQQVLRVSTPTTDIGGAVIPALSGTVSAGADMAYRLHLAAMNFARDYKDQSVDDGQVRDQARKVEAAAMAAVTLGVLLEADGIRLIDDLQALVERR